MDSSGIAPSLASHLPTALLIDGVWAPASTGATFEVGNPATEETLFDVADASPVDGLRALDAAAGAAAAWRRTPPRVRSEVLRDIFDRVTARADDLATLITAECGKPLAESRTEVAYGAEFIRWYSEQAVRSPGLVRAAPSGTGTQLVRSRPVGPALLITPWNFPLAMVTRKIAPALAAGCTVVIKPARLTPLTTLYVAEIIREALVARGLPAGVINVVPTSSSAAVTEPILADPRLRKLSFTGSTPVGQGLLRSAAAGVLRTSMELGGNAPFLVFADADLDAAVSGAMVAKMRNSGQTCVAANRFLVHSSVAAEFTDRLRDAFAALVVGDGSVPEVTVGPLIEEGAVDKVAAAVQGAVDDGARVRIGGNAPSGKGHFYLPTVLSDVSPESLVVTEETFGPVAPVVTFGSEEEALALANATEYGLVAYAYTRDVGRAMRLTEEIEAGMIGINRGLVSDASAPFGGLKHSGLGREGGEAGIEEYLESVYVAM
ncbi:succinate-semialdehyde dehydrogenase / glutarate-semialdehyde dehydrogenase [Sanguibacter gelidistatuariae]|uniref:Succinate-semialdehyde dehydrogenase / glutarate-semialdehyde dehydrogenase n=1 Tax=Sanguibacter gelidistatuariae TaxID=1814289 RepID=A0A1G6NQB5_9MICO|nr:NAD-dependent succinate-semialdehyde dehydrogenase [Sanguibacter gelidistatuariae]SDC69898.1 succinate-semialdehyde dehydrogenase / glutarate-semialdehyde dehydrogenase [Sanguibacter gelidistatuariae]